MKRMSIGVLALVVLTGCGVDGAPFRPTANAGVSIGTGGISADCSIGTTNGTVSVKVGC